MIKTLPAQPTSDSQHHTVTPLIIENGWLTRVEHCHSPHFSPRQASDGEISLLVIHNISLPPKQFSGDYIQQFFQGKLDASAHPYFQQIAELRVSAHCLIRRNGQLIQFVSFNDKAWHAGVSVFQGREKCNDFSIGIELEGADDIPYESIQYQQLARLTHALQQHYPLITRDRIVGHCDIAPERKTDPGESFDWALFHSLLV
jgi:AmpD protein